MFHTIIEGGFALAVEDVEKVGEHAGEHLTRGGEGEVPVFEFLILAAEDFRAVLAGEDAAVMERVEEHVVVAAEKVSGQIHAGDIEAGALADEHVNEGEGDGDAFARVEHAGEEGISFVVIVVVVPMKNEFTGEEVGHDGDAAAAGGGAFEAAGEFGAPGGEALAVGSGFKPGDHRRAEQPAGFFEVGGVVEGGAEKFEAVEGFILHDFVEDFAGVEGGDRVVATGEVAEVFEIASAVVEKLLFDEPHGLLVFIGEQSDESCFLRMHALTGN